MRALAICGGIIAATVLSLCWLAHYGLRMEVRFHQWLQERERARVQG